MLRKEILNEKENLSELRECMINKTNRESLIQGSINIPGENKNITLMSELYEICLSKTISKLRNKTIEISFFTEFTSPLGNIFLIKIKEDAQYLKSIALNIESTELIGSYFDLDVFTFKHQKISRKLGNSRKCFICNSPAKVCSYLVNHTVSEIINKMEINLNEYRKKHNFKVLQ